MFHHIQTHAFIKFRSNFICKMKSRLLTIVAIIVVVGFASNILLVHPAFAADTAARKVAKERDMKLREEAKKAKIKDAATKIINILNNKLAVLQDELGKKPGDSALISKIADVQSKIAKWQQKL